MFVLFIDWSALFTKSNLSKSCNTSPIPFPFKQSEIRENQHWLACAWGRPAFVRRHIFMSSKVVSLLLSSQSNSNQRLPSIWQYINLRHLIFKWLQIQLYFVALFHCWDLIYLSFSRKPVFLLLSFEGQRVNQFCLWLNIFFSLSNQQLRQSSMWFCHLCIYCCFVRKREISTTCFRWLRLWLSVMPSAIWKLCSCWIGALWQIFLIDVNVYSFLSIISKIVVTIFVLFPLGWHRHIGNRLIWPDLLNACTTKYKRKIIIQSKNEEIHKSSMVPNQTNVVLL